MSVLTGDSVLSLTEQVAQAQPGVIPCRGNDSDSWFAQEQSQIENAQRLCRGCPLQAQCLAGAIARAEPCGVWGGELFEQGKAVAQKKPKGRPRNDAQLIEARAQILLAQRLSVLSDAMR